MTGLPPVNAAELYINNLELAWATATTLTVAAGRARNSTNQNDIILEEAVTINGAANGANGLDIGSLDNNTFYAVYVIGDSFKNSPTAAIISADTAQPLLPANYDMYRRIGWVLTDSSAEFLLFWQFGNQAERQYYYDAGISALSTGSSATFTEIDLSTSVPPIATEVLFDVTYTPNAATDVAEFLPFGSSATTGIVRFGYGVAGAQVGMVTVPCRLDADVPKIQYKVTAGDTLTMLTVGYKDYL